ncbi:hypothetical protein Tfer_2382 [Thermincola ferriacetica]|uniref:Uncharacterized protein n=1 Tax=Thermincola ferriacetica TaxID=281456 RepID=A0A0L6W0G8_9FIRM|nr:hypothetical protein [Thermincola ferriacetica]KNZ69020.1 hypothetical protein Tfer_2382 [Thermincola ferriacetica]
MFKVQAINDRLVSGVIAGMAGALAQNLYALVAKLLGLTDIIYVDIAAAVLFHRNYPGWVASVVGLAGHLVVDSFWGFCYALIIEAGSSRYLYFKGAVFGMAIWFLIRVIGVQVLELPVFTGTSPVDALVYFFGGILFGLTISYVLRLLQASH